MAVTSAARLLAISLLAVLSVNGCAASSNRNPGISLRLSQSFFTYILEQIADPMIQKELGKVSLPNITYHVSGLNFDIFLTQMGFLLNTYKFQPGSFLQPNTGLSALEAKVGFYIEGTGKWKSRARWWPYITESGNVYFYTRPMWVQVAISMRPGSNGLWNFTMVEFAANCNLDVRFTGDGMSGIDVGALRKYISEKANEAANGALGTAIVTFLKDLTPTMKKYLPYVVYKNCTHFGIPDCEDFALNLSLSSAGVWKQNCSAEIQLDGYLLFKNQAFLPTAAAAFPPEAGCGSHGLSLLLSGGTFSSVVAAILASGLVHGNFPTDKFTDDPTYDKYIPGLAKYGHLPLYANLTLLNSSMSITGKEMRVQFGACFKVLVDTTPSKLLPNKIFAEALNMVVTTTVGLTAWLGNITTPDGVMSLLYLNFSTSSVDGVTVSNSSVGPVDVDKIHTLMQQLLNQGFQNADEFLVKGMLIIPKSIGKVELHHPQLTIGEGYLKLAIDVGAVNATTDREPVASQENFQQNYDPSGHDWWQKRVADIDYSKVPQSVSEALEVFVDAFLESQVRLAKIAKQAFVRFAVDGF